MSNWGLQLGAQLGRAEQIGVRWRARRSIAFVDVAAESTARCFRRGPLRSCCAFAVGPRAGDWLDFVPAPLNTDVSIDGLLQVSLQPVAVLPLRLSMLFGYAQDRSLRALDAQDCMGGTVADCLRVRLESTAAYGVGLPRVRGSLGVELPLFCIGFVDHTGCDHRIEAIVGDPDPVLIALFGMGFPGGAAPESLSAVVDHRRSLGPGKFAGDRFGVRVGLQSAGYAMGAKLPKVMGFGGLSWELDLLATMARAGAAGL